MAGDERLLSELSTVLEKITDAVRRLERIAGGDAADAALRQARADAEQARMRYQTRTAELAAAHHERDAALAEAGRQTQAAAEAARDRDQVWRFGQGQIAVFEDALAGLRMLAEHAEMDHARILDERDQAQADLGRVRDAAVVALAACEQSLGHGGDAGLIVEAVAALRTITSRTSRLPTTRRDDCLG